MAGGTCLASPLGSLCAAMGVGIWFFGIAAKRGVSFELRVCVEASSVCGLSSVPICVAAAITVGSTDSGDNMQASESFGSCIDVFAPGTANPREALLGCHTCGFFST